VKTQKRVLLVGEQQPLWREFIAYSTANGDEWVPQVAPTGGEALTMAAFEAFDAIVAEAQLAGTHGVELLDELMRLRPDAIRIVLSDLSDPASTLQCVGKVHRHLVLPCDAMTLNQALEQAVTADTWLPDPAVQKLLPQMRWVPSPPEVYFEVMSEMQSDDASVEKIGELISRDPAISAKLLQLANSAVFGLQLQVVQPAEAVAYVGLETTRSLLLLAHTFASFENLHADGFKMEALWRHSAATGRLARIIANEENSGPDIADQSFTAGLLHDIGKLLFAANLPKEFSRALQVAQEKGCRPWEAEMEILGTCHGQLGGALLSIWGLPLTVVEAIALHHLPGCRVDAPFGALTAVHVADVIEHESSAENSSGTAAVFDSGYLAALGLEERVDEWRRRCLDTVGS
jgi:HD-like signal output (HDOD) protein/CheY-like chemotaxis protein